MQNHAGLSAPPALVSFTQRQKISLFLDFDGTLVGLAEKPDLVSVPMDLTKNLENLAQSLNGRMAIITGRPLAALDGFLGPNHIKAVGSHGGEFRGAPPPPPPLSEQSLNYVNILHQSIPNLFIEHKPYGLAIHYRQEPDAASRVYNLMEKIAEDEDLALKPGKMLVEIGPAQANKGVAVRNLMGTAPFIGSRPIFIGDDITDEDGFKAVSEAGGHGILVGTPRESLAEFHLHNPGDVLKWLQL